MRRRGLAKNCPSLPAHPSLSCCRPPPVFPADSRIFGADVDPGIATFPRDAGVKTLVVDSTVPGLPARSFVGTQFDIVIDDGSHATLDQLRTFQNLWPLMHPTGVYIVEDLLSEWEGRRAAHAAPRRRTNSCHSLPFSPPAPAASGGWEYPAYKADSGFKADMIARARRGEIRWFKYADTSGEALLVILGPESLAVLPAVGLLDSSGNYLDAAAPAAAAPAAA